VHGTNDAQKTMGVIVLALVFYGALPESGFEVPIWVIVAAASAMALGTYFGGWRIIRTMGHRVTDIDTPQGFSAETSCAAVILASSALGFPLSTTHVVSGAVAGSGFGRYRRLRSIRWDIARNIILAWLLTLPGAAMVVGLASAAVVATGEGVFGAVVVGVLVIAGVVGLWWTARRAPVTPDNVNEVQKA
jgi:PiT family inorganic phosphate transporter